MPVNLARSLNTLYMIEGGEPLELQLQVKANVVKSMTPFWDRNICCPNLLHVLLVSISIQNDTFKEESNYWYHNNYILNYVTFHSIFRINHFQTYFSAAKI